MVKLAIDSWGSGEYQKENESNQPHEAGLLKLDISKVKSELNWIPKMKAIETVQFTIDWYKNFKYDIPNVNDFTTYQIISFLND
jgi:CDP-glucose 4,6-dehydratase